MAEATVQCPHCQSKAVVKYGKTSTGKERFRCQQRHRSVANFLVNLVAGLIAYSHQEKKPSLHIRMPNHETLPACIV
jgi:hypothetical protein